MWLIFEGLFDRALIQSILTDAIKNSTQYSIKNGTIEIFPKGAKGTGLYLPFFGLFKENNVEISTNNFLNDQQEVDTERILTFSNLKENNTNNLSYFNELFLLPPCFLQAQKNWVEGSRNNLTMGLAGICKKILKMSKADATTCIQLICLFRQDKEVANRINTVAQTYNKENVVACSLLKKQGVCIDGCSFTSKKAAPSASYDWASTVTVTPQVIDVSVFASIAKTEMDLRALPPVEYLVPELLPKKIVMMIYGQGGGGKTWILLDLARSISKGGFVWGKYLSSPQKVLFLEGDTGEHLIASRVRMFEKAENNHLIFVNRYIAERNEISLSLSHEIGRANIQRLIEQHEPDLVILDTFISFLDGDENKIADTKPAIDFLRHLAEEKNCTLLVSHHSRKPSNKDSSKRQLTQSDLIGTSALARLAGCTLAVNPIYESDGNEVKGSGYVATTKSWFKNIRPFSFTLVDYDIEGIAQIRIDYNHDYIPKNCSKQRIAEDFVLSQITSDPSTRITKKMIVEQTGVSEGTVKRALDKLCAENIIHFIGHTNDRYYLRTGEKLSELQ